MDKKTLKNYTVCFGLFFFLMIGLPRLISGTNLFPEGDGTSQQLVYFAYSGKWIREILHNIFIEHTIVIPMWDMSIGMGSDLLIPCVGLLDPLNWISVFFPIEYATYAFDALIIIKFYLCGLSYLFLAHERGYKGYPALSGALIYVFSASTMVGLLQANFLNMFYLFPLLVVGTDRLWEKKGFVFYTVVLTMCTFYSSYFMYMMGLIIIAYCVIRFFCEKDRTIRKLLSLLGRFILFTVIGVIIGMGIYIPGLLNLFSLDRFSLPNDYPMVLSLDKSLSLITNYFSYYETGTDGIWGFSAVVLYCAWSLFRKKGMGDIKVKLIVYTLSFFIPFIGSMFNIFHAPTYRYIFGYILLLSYIVTVEYHSLDQIKISKGNPIWFIIAVYSVIALVAGDFFSIISVLSLILTGLILFLVNSKYSGVDQRKNIGYLTAVFVSCALIAVCFFVDNKYDMTPMGKSSELLLKSSGESIIVPQMTDSVRYDCQPLNYTDRATNASMLLGLKSYDYYHSNYDNNVDRFYDELAIISDSRGFCYTGLRGREYLEHLCGTKYLLVSDSLSFMTPYSYSDTGEASGGYSLYTTDRDVSMVSYFDTVYSEEQYNAMTPYERETALLQGIVLDQINSIEVCELADEDDSILPYTLFCSEGITIEDNLINVESADAYICLCFDSIADSDIELYLDDLRYIPDRDVFYYQLYADLYDGDEFLTGDAYVGFSENHPTYHDKTDLMVDYGFVDHSADQIRLVFGTAGRYSCEGITVYRRSQEQIVSALDAYYDAKPDSECVFDDNAIDVTYTTDRSGYILLAVPYSSGWSAVLDGEECEIIKADTAFMAVKTEAGTHNLSLVYRTPNIGTGALVSATGIILLIAAIAVDSKIGFMRQKESGT